MSQCWLIRGSKNQAVDVIVSPAPKINRIPRTTAFGHAKYFLEELHRFIEFRGVQLDMREM
jgi:hypothetical protein